MSTIHEIAGRNVAVQCSNRAQAIAFVDAAYRAGYRWKEWPRTKTGWSKNGSGTCYRISPQGIIMFADVSYYRNHPYTIIPFADFSRGDNGTDRQALVADSSPSQVVKGVEKAALTFRNPFKGTSLRVKPDKSERIRL